MFWYVKSPCLCFVKIHQNNSLFPGEYCKSNLHLPLNIKSCLKSLIGQRWILRLPCRPDTQLPFWRFAQHCLAPPLQKQEGVTEKTTLVVVLKAGYSTLSLCESVSHNFSIARSSQQKGATLCKVKNCARWKLCNMQKIKQCANLYKVQNYAKHKIKQHAKNMQSTKVCKVQNYARCKTMLWGASVGTVTWSFPQTTSVILVDHKCYLWFEFM